MVKPYLGKSKQEDINDAVLNSEYDEKRKNYRIRNQLLKKYEAFKQEKVGYLYQSLIAHLDQTKKECDIDSFHLDFIDVEFSQTISTINCKIGVDNIRYSEIKEGNCTYNTLFFLKKCSKCKKEMCKEEFSRFSELLYLIDKYKEKLKCENCLKIEV